MSLRDDFIRAIRFHSEIYNGCLPTKIIFQSQELFEQLKLPAWLLSIPREVNNEIDVPWIFIEPKFILHHKKCCACGLVRDVIEFEHELDEEPVCNHCFKKMFTKDEDWEKIVKEKNDDVKKHMPTDYLNIYGKMLFEEQTTQS